MIPSTRIGHTNQYLLLRTMEFKTTPSLVESFTPSTNVNDEFDNFSELALEYISVWAFWWHNCQVIETQRLYITAFPTSHLCSAVSQIQTYICETMFIKFGWILEANHTIKCQEKAQKNIANNSSGHGQEVRLWTQNKWRCNCLEWLMIQKSQPMQFQNLWLHAVVKIGIRRCILPILSVSTRKGWHVLSLFQILL